MIRLFPKDKTKPKSEIIEQMKQFGNTFAFNYGIYDTNKGQPEKKEHLRLEIEDDISREVLDNSYLWNLQQYK